MQILIPKELYTFRRVDRKYSGNEILEEGPFYCAYSVGGSQSIQVESFFYEEPKGDGHNLCHVKPMGVDIQDSSGKRYIVNEWVQTNPNSKGSKEQSYMQNSVITGNHTVIAEAYCVFDRGYTSYVKWHLSLDCYDSTEPKRGYMYGRGICEATFKVTDHGVDFSYGSTYTTGMAMSSSEWKDVLRFCVPKEVGPHYNNDVITFAEKVIYYMDNVITTTQKKYPGQRVTVRLPDSAAAATQLVFQEYDYIQGNVVTKPYAAYHLNALRQAAYLDALDSIPQMNENSLSNVLEVVSFLKALIIDHRVEIPNSWQSSWLSYRYQYTTTKLDAEEAINFFRRTVNKEFLVQGFSCYGSASDIIEDTEVIVKCRFSAKQKEMEYLDRIITGLYQYGLSPSFYMVWDMIPYSFIVDWFIPVGDILSGYDKTRMYDREFSFSDLWFSVSYDFAYEGTKFHAYTRWSSASPPEFNGYYTLENKGTPSTKVIGYRILDVMSMIIR